jgi:TetR/AcrR family transcriptional repressor of nem operon
MGAVTPLELWPDPSRRQNSQHISALTPGLDYIPTGWYVQGVPKIDAKRDARAKLLDAALSVIRTKGYSAASVDELCTKAGVTKGAFFHHFKSKEELAVAAADYWSEMTAALFAAAPYHDHADALDRFLAYVAFRKALLQGGVPDFTCLVGTMVQETYETAPVIREACERCITGHAATLEADIEAALRERNMTPEWTARSLALHTQAVIQGAFILAKATGGAEIAADSIDHLHRYLESLFNPRNRVGKNIT